MRITGYTDTGYSGVLYNEPRTAGAPVAVGKHVEFDADHIIDALPPESWNPKRARARTNVDCRMEASNRGSEGSVGDDHPSLRAPATRRKTHALRRPASRAPT